MVGQESVTIYLNSYNLETVPRDIGKLVKAKRLFIGRDTLKGWTVYPPFSALQQRAQTPPFYELPVELTNLTNLTRLELVGLDLNKLPDDFYKLHNLDSLNLMLNKLTISSEISKLRELKKLKYLALFGNNIDTTDIIELKRAIPGIEIYSGLD